MKNDKIRLVQALQARRRARQREHCFVIEGARICEEALRAGLVPQFALYTAEIDPRATAVLEAWQAAGVPCLEVSATVMTACSDTETPQGLLAVVPIPEIPLPSQPTLTLIPDQLRDPGNLGTLLRTALAAGVDQALLPPGTVDATNPKVVRSGAGAHFRLPLAAVRWDDIPKMVAGCRVYLAEAGASTPYTAVDWTEPVALIVGGEASGAGSQAQALADERIAIPMHRGVESLNASVAAAVILFEVVRQRQLRRTRNV